MSALLFPPVSSFRTVRDGHPIALALYGRHYSAQPKHNRKQFVGPGWSTVLLTHDDKALFVWQKQKYRADKQQGVNCAVFRNEGTALCSSSELIQEAQEIAWARWPGERLFTFVNASAVKSENPGYCFKKAGWRTCGLTKGGLVILEHTGKGVANA